MRIATAASMLIVDIPGWRKSVQLEFLPLDADIAGCVATSRSPVAGEFPGDHDRAADGVDDSVHRLDVGATCPSDGPTPR
jgi:hypothetical protein